MKIFITIIMLLFGLSTSSTSVGNTVLDYRKMIILDAEDLAETGIKDAYEKLKPLLRSYVTKPAEIVETFNSDLPSYSVICEGVTYEIYSPTIAKKEGESWGRATAALFTIINAQLKSSPGKFYAINSGNDLGGMFLTQKQALAAKKHLIRKTDWPYLPTMTYPRYGQYH